MHCNYLKLHYKKACKMHMQLPKLWCGIRYNWANQKSKIFSLFNTLRAGV